LAPEQTSDNAVGRRGSRTEDLLREPGQRLGCAAVALLTATGSITRIWSRSRTAAEFAGAEIAAITAVLLARSVAQRETVVSKHVRRTESGPVVARLIALPVASGSQRPVGILVALWRPSDPPFKKSAQQQLQGLADTLARRRQSNREENTGLLNWSGFCSRMEHFVSTQAADASIAILYGNIDQLHLLNDARGMAAGDEAIAHCSLVIRRVVCAVRHAACRLSGDRFVVALPGHTVEQARIVAEKIRADFEIESQRVFGAGVTLSVSWGVVCSRSNQADIEHALTDAELACRAAKDRGRNRVETFESTDASMIRRHDDIDALRLLRDALDAGRLVIFAQPIVALLNVDLPTSYELLVRIAAKDGRIAEPAEFMSAAARYQMLPELDRAVIRTAFTQLRAAVPDDERLPFNFSVNLAANTLSAPGFDSWLLETMQQHAIPPNQLTIEITESTAASSLDNLQRCIAGLVRAGVRFAIDDFGTGVNSLSHLKTLDIAMIKLDGSYVRDAGRNARSQALVSAIVQLADSMGIVTVAEYVDHVALRTRLAELGVHFAQGFAVGRPEPLAEVLAVLPAAAVKRIA
jgi:diguanylate cyclase (GGDEF)-like protein